jgi:Na+/H+ antiporter NhaD/arsenite permease-like protein
LKEIIRRVPWKVIPFIIGLFIIVDGLASAGWTDMLASQLSRIGNPVLLTVAITYLSLALCNFMNNHPASIFLVRTFQSRFFIISAAFGIGSSLALKGSSLALILGANFGANLTLMGSLAGLMWAKILSDKGQPVSFSGFSKYGLLIMPIVAAVACLGLAAELALWV